MSGRLYTVADVAKAWHVSQQRIRQLIQNKTLEPDFYTDEPRYYWLEIPEREAHHDE